MIIKQLFIFTWLLLLAVACNKEDCVTCENGQLSEEICKDDEITYTDDNGQIIGEADAYIAWLEANGYECN